MMSFAAQRKNIKYESFVHPDVERDLRVMRDPGRLRQILTNLLTNSIKFTSEGWVRLAVSTTGQAKEAVAVRFVIEDTGIGIEDEVRRRLFQPFSQADFIHCASIRWYRSGTDFQQKRKFIWHRCMFALRLENFLKMSLIRHEISAQLDPSVILQVPSSDETPHSNLAEVQEEVTCRA